MPEVAPPAAEPAPPRRIGRGDVIRALLRVSAMNAFQYRASFLFEFTVASVNTAGIVLPLWTIFGHWEAVAGWSFPEALLVTACFQLLSAGMGGLVEPNLGAVVEGVRNGQFDYLLVKPVDAQLVASLHRSDPARIWDLVGAIGLGAWALSGLPTPAPVDVGVAAGMLVAGFAAMYSLWVLVICLSFWFVRVDNLRYLLGAITDAGRWPVSIYRGFVRMFLTVIIPVALVTSWPAMALTGRMTGALALQALGVGVGMVVVSRLAWVRAIRRYASASS